MPGGWDLEVVQQVCHSDLKRLCDPMQCSQARLHASGFQTIDECSLHTSASGEFALANSKSFPTGTYRCAQALRHFLGFPVHVSCTHDNTSVAAASYTTGEVRAWA
jgi:hypothetical protein